MLTSEDITLFWDRLTTWLFSQSVTTVLLVGLMCFLCWLLIREMDKNTVLQQQIISISRERITK